VARDLRVPLQVIALKAELLRRWGAREGLGQAFDCATAILRRLARAEGLIRDLLDASGIEEGQLRIATQEQDFVGVVEDVIRARGPSAENRSVTLEAAPGEGPVLAAIDPERIARALASLVENAVEWAPAESVVRVSVVRDHDEVGCTVTDTGPSIADDVLPAVFESYVRNERGKGRGGGLGLYAAAGIVRAHGGRIWAENVKGAGVRFSFRVPRVP